MMSLYRSPENEGLWSDTHQGFPWYIDEEPQKEQTDDVVKLLDNAWERMHFTPDFPKLQRFAEHYIFVYGTLKSGKINHKKIKHSGCRYVADGFTHDKTFQLKETRGGIPVALGTFGDRDQSNSHRIAGELYLVDTDVVPDLDGFEQNGVLYRRGKMRIMVGADLVPAWMYLGLKNAWSNEKDLTFSPHHTSAKDKTLTYYSYAGTPLKKKA